MSLENVRDIGNVFFGDLHRHCVEPAANAAVIDGRVVLGLAAKQGGPKARRLLSYERPAWLSFRRSCLLTRAGESQIGSVSLQKVLHDELSVSGRVVNGDNCLICHGFILTHLLV